MCIMCIEIAKQRMTIKEARQALVELVLTTENEEMLAHYKALDSASDEELQKLAQDEAEKASS